MRILVVSQYFWPENFRVNDLVAEWVKRGHEVTVLTGVPNYPLGKIFEDYRSNPKAFRSFDGASVVRVPIFCRGNGLLRLILNYFSFVFSSVIFGSWRLRGIKVDVIFVFEPSPVTVGLPAILIGKLKRAPIVFWVLDLWPETLAALGIVRSQRMLNYIGVIVHFIYDECALVLGQSRGFLNNIAKYCTDKEKIRYFPSWSENIFAEELITPAPEILPTLNTFNILFAGNIGEAQDMPAILDAAEYLKCNPTIRWIIVGDGSMSEWLKSQVVRRGLSEKFILAGYFPVERMPSFYAHADALLVSLKRDPVFSMTIPGKVQSYLMAGIPIVGMLDGEGANVIRDANAGLICEAGNSVGLAKAVLKLSAMSKEARYELGRNGKKYAKQEFDRSRLMDRIENLMYEAVISSKYKS